jgi:aspartate-semialdehyde dehydrogenase
MVGSVLVQRMREERDFDLIDPIFFSTSQSGTPAPAIGKPVPAVKDANNLAALMSADVLISCQGGDYTSEIHPRLRAAGWTGHWIDAASTLRMKDRAVIVLDPVNRRVIDAALDRGINDFIGGNCTVSLMLMAIIKSPWSLTCKRQTYRVSNASMACRTASIDSPVMAAASVKVKSR